MSMLWHCGKSMDENVTFASADLLRASRSRAVIHGHVTASAHGIHATRRALTMRVRRRSVAASISLLTGAMGLPVPAESVGRHASHQSAACDPSTSFHFMHLGVCHCPCVLIDVGLNTGKSLKTWAAEAATRAERHSARLAECASSSYTCYYGFEANPAFDARLQSLETKLRGEGTRVKLFTSTAFNLHSNAAEFMVDRSTRQNSEGEAVTSTLESSKRLVFQDRAGNWRHRNATVAERFKRTLVRSTDASAFFASVLGAYA